MNQQNENPADTINEGENTVDIESDKFKELIQKWAKILEKYEKLRLDEREYETRVNRTIKRDTMKNINFIVGQHLKQASHDTGISFWDLNVSYYSAAVTVLQQEGLLKEIKNANRNVKPGWQMQLEQQISSYRRQLAFVDLILYCKKEGKYTKDQCNIEHKLKKWYGRMSVENLIRIRTELKQKLAVAAEKLRRKKMVKERDMIIQKLSMNPKAVYRKFKADKEISVENPSTKESTESFWKNIWGLEQQYNKNADWLPKYEKDYCKNVEPTKYELTFDVLNKIFNKAANNKALGRDRIVMYWLKKVTSAHRHFLNILISLKKNELEVPLWLSTTRTTLLPKNSGTDRPENYRPIALQNSRYKVYTSILNHFLEDHAG